MDKGQFRLRPLEIKDADRMLEWMHDEDATRYLRLDGKNATKEDAIRFIEDATDESVNLHRAIVDGQNKYLGTVSLKNIDHEKREAEYAIAMHPDAMGSGAARLATNEILHLAFDNLALNRVYLNVLADNQRAVGFYSKLSESGLCFKEKTATDIGGTTKVMLWYEVLKSDFCG